MTRPATPLILWSTDALYPAGAEAFSATSPRVAPVSGLIAQGWQPKQKPAAQNINYILRNFSDWIGWAAEDKTLAIAPPAWALEPGLTWTQNPRYVFCGAAGGGEAMYPIALPVGSVLKSVTLALEGDGVGDPVITVQKISAVGTVSATLATLSLTNLAASWANHLINFAADTGAMDLDNTTDGVTVIPFQRATGSFITDGFTPGMTITSSGFTNAGNNGTWTVIAVTALTLTTTSTVGMVAEFG